MNYKRKYLALLNTGLVNKEDDLLYYATDRTIIQKIKNKRRRLNNLFEVSNEKAEMIQKNIKNYIFIQKLKDLGCLYKNKNYEYVNDFSLIGEKIWNIDDTFFYKYTENKTRYFAFDIRCLHKILKVKNKNPYTLLEFPPEIILQINRRIDDLKRKNISLSISNSIPIQSRITAELATTFNKMTFLNIYPNIDRLMDLNITFLFYYTQDLMTSPLLDTHIDRYYYNRILGIYNTSVRRSITEFTRKSYKDKIIIYLLKVINHILDIKDDFQSTRALAINEILQNNYESFGEDVDELDNMDDLDSPQLFPISSIPISPLRLPPRPEIQTSVRRENSISNLPPIIERSIGQNETTSTQTNTEIEEPSSILLPPEPQNRPQIPLRSPSPINLQDISNSQNSNPSNSLEESIMDEVD
jgi:hypothetical protein